jgi:RNA polymerase-binding transcription factor DksA
MAKAKPVKTASKPKKTAPAKSAAKPAVKAAKSEAKPVPSKPSVKVKLKPRTPKAAPAKPAAATAHKGNGTAAAAPKAPAVKVKLTPFLEKQKERLLQLRDSLLDAMAGVAKDNLRARAEGSEASAFGMHQADAGSDAYDRDFALSLLSQEQDALYEIEEALKRLDLGTYGVCEMSGKPIAHARLEALPFARLTVECQSQVEKMGKVTRARVPVTSLFGLTDEEPGETEEEEPVTETKE